MFVHVARYPRVGSRKEGLSRRVALSTNAVRGGSRAFVESQENAFAAPPIASTTLEATRRHHRRLTEKDALAAVRRGEDAGSGLRKRLEKAARKRARKAAEALDRTPRRTRHRDMAGRAQGQEGGGGAHAAASGGGGGARSVLGALTGSDGSGAAATERARASMSSRELAELRGKVTRWDGPAGAQRGREAGRGHSGRGGVPEGVRDGAVAGVLVVGVLGAAAVAVRAFQGGGGRRERDGQGKWVRDRSLGGRLVKVEGRGGKGVEGLNPLEGVATDGLEREGSPRGRTGERGSERREVAMPSWWERPRGAAPPESVRERAKKDAQSLLRRMEAEKVASGRDIPLEGLVRVRQLCQEGRCTVRASTPAARDAMLRLAVEEAVQSAALGSTLRIGGMRPAQLIGGLAADLEVADADARRMALGGVAKKLRDLLVGACAAVRKGDEAEVLRAAAAVAAVLEALPLGEGSAEGEMVAAGIRSVFGRKERERVLEAVEAVAEGSSVAEMARELLDLASPEWAPGMGPD